jgi:hypothetical protein
MRVFAELFFEQVMNRNLLNLTGAQGNPMGEVMKDPSLAAPWFSISFQNLNPVLIF